MKVRLQIRKTCVFKIKHLQTHDAKRQAEKRCSIFFYFHQTTNPLFIPTQTIRSSFQKSVVGARSSVILDSDIIEDKKVYFSTNSRVFFFFFLVRKQKKKTNKQKQTNKQQQQQQKTIRFCRHFNNFKEDQQTCTDQYLTVGVVFANIAVF